MIIQNVRKYIRCSLLATGLIGVWCAMIFPGVAEVYARQVYPVIAWGLSHFSSLFPFSVGDCFIYGSIVGLLLFPVYAYKKKYSWKSTIGRMIEYLLWVYVWFYLAWGLNYFRVDFYTRAQVQYVPYVAEDFKSFLSDYTDSLNTSFLFYDKIDTALVSAEVKKGYDTLSDRFGMIKPSGCLRPKPMLIPPLMSGVGVLGYMGPFFNEYNLNPDLLPVQYPFTYAHEMAHVLGIANEAEANLYGFMVCSRSLVPEIRFSAYFALLTYVLNNAYLLLNEEEFNQWKDTISPEVRNLYNQKLDYWRSRYNPLIGDAQDVLYDWFLKGNNIPSGYQNYSEVIALLMAVER